jgi:hypothetical protein
MGLRTFSTKSETNGTTQWNGTGGTPLAKEAIHSRNTTETGAANGGAELKTVLAPVAKW